MQVKLVGSDGESVTVDSEIVKKCMKTVKDLLDEGNFDPEEEISVPVVNGEILKKIIDWVIYHNGEPPVYEEATDLTEWDKKFLEVDDDTLYDIIEAAKYLEMPGLLQLCHAHL